MKPVRLSVIASFLLGAAATYIGAEVSRAFWAWNDSPGSVGSYVASTIVSWLLMLLGGTGAALLANRYSAATPANLVNAARLSRHSASWRLVRSTTAFVVTAAWLATAVVGSPAVITASTARDIASYKWIAQQQALPLSAPFPRINHTVSAPLLPGVLLLWHGVQLAGQAGGGGWELWLWYGATPRLMHSWPRWYS